MKLKNEDELDNYIICQMCSALHEEVPIHDGSRACCSSCGSVLYHHDNKLIENGLSLSITGIIFFIVANSFPLVKIEILGKEQYITIVKTFVALFENGFYIVGMLCLFLIFLFPLMIFLLNITIFALLKLQIKKDTIKELLILLGHIKPWSMSEIFLVSILVSLVKLIGYAQINMGVSFWGLIVFVIIDIYITKTIHLREIWMLRKRIFRKSSL